MSAILDSGLGEQLAAALLAWGGEHDREPRRQPRKQPARHHNQDSANFDSDLDSGSDSDSGSGSGSGSLTPLARHHVYIRQLMRFADDNTWNMTALDPRERDIDADLDEDHDDDLNATASDSTFTTQPTKASNIGGRYRQHREDTMKNPPSPPQKRGKQLPPTPIDTTPDSSHPQMSCRISSFPFLHPCDIPELILDPDEDLLHTGPSPLPSGPATPSVVNDVFRPLSHTASPDLGFGPFTPFALEADPRRSLQQQPRKMSVITMVSEVSDGLGIIEEEDDVNTDGVSMLTPTEASFGGPVGGESSHDRFGRVDSRGYQPQARSISSSAGSTGSSEWRPSNRSISSRKSVALFSRMRGRHSVVQEEPLERRSLTPYELSAPAPRQDDDSCADQPPPPTGSSLSTIHSRTEIASSANSRFFGRMPWLTNSQPEKQGTVFGVDLNSSIKLAPMKIRVSHRGKGSSYRTYPLGVYKCCEFIKREGIRDGRVFCSPGNAFNVAQLKEIFNTGPTYGENFQFEGTDYTVHDAARLILLYLEELPKPLISSSVVRCWVLLARQEGAIEPPCPRVETGLDFWTEALSRLPTASRNLVKHLLALFAEVLIQATGDITEADSRHLASAVSRALFHQDTDASVVAGGIPSTVSKKKTNKKNVHPTLALAFLIKKRGEYSATLGKATNMGTKRDTQFLPTTKEMMQWKG
ncbi:hypothetical protein QBC40DRAFT_252195 [Triangularia verruculosa]|uniref:Rho-GAP domain-containing protein n=1 Tax=Triangularia verruculosa TaxID=2587418 RepID=A0AAN6XR69_9PEZI|nr:hypothetical protein QBC40DRAFT_252195 [Triangularia verruculosa]